MEPLSHPTFSEDGYQIEIAVVGYPGKWVGHGGLGWSAIALPRVYGCSNPQAPPMQPQDRWCGAPQKHA